MKKPLAFALAAAASLLVAGAAQAGSNIYWSIGINAPPVATVISNAPAYGGYGGYSGYGGHGGYYAPAPVYAHPPAVVYAPAPRAYYPPQVVYQYERPVPIYHHGQRRDWDRDRDGIPDRYDRYDNRQDRGYERGANFRDRDGDGIPNRWDRYDGRNDNRRYGY